MLTGRRARLQWLGSQCSKGSRQHRRPRGASARARARAGAARGAAATRSVLEGAPVRRRRGPRIRRKCVRRFASDPSPARTATWSTARSERSSSSRARSTRARSTHCIGVYPVSSTKRRENVRGETLAFRASTSSVSGSARCRTAHSRVSAKTSPRGSGMLRGTYCACPPLRYGALTSRRATWLDSATPWSCRTMCRHRSMPLAAPALVSTDPASTNSTSSSTSTPG